MFNTFLSQDNKDPLVCVMPGGLCKGPIVKGAKGLRWPNHVPGACDEEATLAKGDRQRGTPVDLLTLGEKGES